MHEKILNKLYPKKLLKTKLVLGPIHYKGTDPIFKLSQWSYHNQIWHAQRKQSELGSILMNCFVILNILASRRNWTFFFWGGSRFWRKNKVPSGQRNRQWVRSETQKWRKIFLWCNLIFGIEINQNFHFHSLQLFLLIKLIQK